jgi:HEAT repeat protein
MGFYNLSKNERIKLTGQIHRAIEDDCANGDSSNLIKYFSDDDTYVRKAAYISVGKIFRSNPKKLSKLINLLDELIKNPDAKIRQTVINSAGEIGIIDFNSVGHLLEIGLLDEHHSVRNAVIGSIKKMSEKNPVPTLAFAKKHLHDTDDEIRREICHGIELRGRTHPEVILPLLKELEFDTSRRVISTVIHVIGQVSYKEKCLEKVIAHLKTWENKSLVKKAIDEILIVHMSYKNFSIKSVEEVREYIKREISW